MSLLKKLLGFIKGEPSEEGSFLHQGTGKMWLLVGLGNPGAKYENNRHNIGFKVIDAIADGAVNFPSYKSKFQADLSEANVRGEKFILLKPQTYMNESGISVGKTAKFYKIPPENIIVFHDELDIKPGDVRLKKGGGNAGHNGLKSIQAHLGTPDFWRFRIGIGHPGDKNRVSGYVLSDFAKAEQGMVEAYEDGFSENYEKITTDDIEAYAQSVIEYVQHHLKKG